MVLHLGRQYITTIFGSSHSDKIGAIIEGCPQGINIDLDYISKEVQRRSTCQTNRYSRFISERKEKDQIYFFSGIDDKNNLSTGLPIGFYALNSDVKVEYYNNFNGYFRPSHIDYTYLKRYNSDNIAIKDIGSARMFLPIVVSGVIAKLILKNYNISINSQIEFIGNMPYAENDKNGHLEQFLTSIQNEGETIGGTIICKIKGIQAGIGNPIFEKISALLAKNIISIPTCYGLEFSTHKDRFLNLGSEDIDPWQFEIDNFGEPTLYTKTNINCGINGGVTNGNNIVFRAKFHPIHTLGKDNVLYNLQGEKLIYPKMGRHDCCHIFRLPVIVESMASITIVDALLKGKKN